MIRFSELEAGNVAQHLEWCLEQTRIYGSVTGEQLSSLSLMNDGDETFDEQLDALIESGKIKVRGPEGY